MRKFLYSKWFFLVLAVVCAVNLMADAAEELWNWSLPNKVAIAMDILALALSLWIFGDLHSRRPGRGNDSRSR
jgi:hypothetical protein